MEKALNVNLRIQNGKMALEMIFPSRPNTTGDCKSFKGERCKLQG
jgi:hypothetical protein